MRTSLPRRRERGQRRERRRATTKPIRPSPGSENVRPTSGVPATTTSEAQALTKPTAAAGRVRPRLGGTGERLRERDAGGEADDRRRDDEQRVRQRQREHDRPGAADDEAAGDPARRVGTAEQRPAGDAREEAEQERERAGDRGGALRVPVVLEQRHDPVADDDAEAERHRVDRGETVEPRVAEEAEAEPLAGVADGTRRRRARARAAPRRSRRRRSRCT